MKNEKVSIKPSEHIIETEQDLLLRMSCEEVIDLKAGSESRRTFNMQDENESVARVRFRVSPSSLIVAIDALASSKNCGRFLVEKCLLHHGVALLSTIPEVGVIRQQYTDILMLGAKYGGITNIIEQITVAQYGHVSVRNRQGEFHGASKLVSALSSNCTGLAISRCQIVAVVLAWSLTTAVSDNLKGIVDELTPEVDQFKQYIQERSFDMKAYWEKAQSRLGKRTKRDIDTQSPI